MIFFRCSKVSYSYSSFIDFFIENTRHRRTSFNFISLFMIILISRRLCCMYSLIFIKYIFIFKRFPQQSFDSLIRLFNRYNRPFIIN
uniref:Uncharacterized protein n=1 Tax=Lepeophtheirus salmonis TaxID=72036 RepID=A0A0K2U3W5_LEPSM